MSGEYSVSVDQFGEVETRPGDQKKRGEEIKI